MNELYPLAQGKIEKNKRKIDRLLEREKDIVVKVEWTEGRFDLFDQPVCYHDFETEFRLYLSYYNMLSEAADRGFDNIPFVRVDFSRVAYLMALAYGCPIIENGNVVNAKHIIGSAEELSIQKKPEHIENAGLYPEILRRMREIERRLGPVGFVASDTQSPIDVLTEIMDTEEALCAMYTDPQAIHGFLQKLTESIAEITAYERTAVTNWIGYGHDYPITKGIHLSDDNAAFLSPAIYQEFARPYNEQLGAIFQGVTLHCCMKYKQNIEVMSNTKKFLGFDPQFAFHSEEDIFPHIRDKGFLRVFWLPEGDKLTFYKNLIDHSESICGLMIDIFGQNKDESLRLADKVKDYAVRVGRTAE